MGDRIVVMKNGVIQQIDTPLSIYNKPANQFVAGFIGSPTMNFFDGKLVHGDSLTCEILPMRFQLPLLPQHHERLLPHGEKEVIVGIRPEHISATPQNNKSIGITVKVDVTEPVGNEIFVYFTLGPSQDQFVSRIPANIHPESGKSVDLYFDTAKLHFFDKSTGDAL
ncbi:MAG: ABC transporter ATP-binding protein, partial [Ignavibacteriales bacterium]|nr:ABC transporter ATP-binding protein [Ignavibacteriales bacterium]